MKRTIAIGLSIFCLLQAGIGVAGGVRGVKNVRGHVVTPRTGALHTTPSSGVRALIRQPVTPRVESAVLRKTFASARQHFSQYPAILKQVKHSLVQISMPNHASVLGNGFVLKERGQLWISMPYHLGGAAGHSRVVRVLAKDGRVLEQAVNIAINGAAGWHAPDISLAKLPESWEGKVSALEVAPANPEREVYSIGYVAGDLGMSDLLPVSSRFWFVDRENMLRQFHITGSTLKNPLSGNGYCGAALLQEFDGKFKVVGMHNGHSLDLENPAASVGSSVNLEAALPQLLDNYHQPMALNRGISFRGWEVDRLEAMERVDRIEIFPADPAREPTVRYMRNFTQPYSDAHVEEALGDIDLQAGDKLIFHIAGRNGANKRVNRQVEFVIP